jgi:hypothetical protein
MEYSATEKFRKNLAALRHVEEKSASCSACIGVARRSTSACKPAMRYRARPVSYFDNEILELERVFASVFLLASPLTGIEAPPPLLALTSLHSARPFRVELDIGSLPVSSLFENHEQISKTMLDAFWSSRDSLSRVAPARHRLDITVKGASRHCESTTPFIAHVFKCIVSYVIISTEVLLDPAPTEMEEPIMLAWAGLPDVPLHPSFHTVARDTSVDESIRLELRAVRDDWYVTCVYFYLCVSGDGREYSIAIHSCVAFRDMRPRPRIQVLHCQWHFLVADGKHCAHARDSVYRARIIQGAIVIPLVALFQPVL